MRVLLVNDRRPAAGSGVEVHLGVLAGALEAAGDTVEVFAGEVHHRHVAKALDVWDPWARRALRARAQRFRADVVHHHNVVRELSVSVLGVPPGVACVLSVHDVRLLTGGEGLAPPLRALPLTLAKRAKGMLDRRVARRQADVVIAHSHAVATRVRAFGFPTVRELPQFAEAPPASRLSPPSSTADVLFAGRLSVEKGVDVLLEAFERLARRHPGARLVVAGDGPERARVERRARDIPGVHLAGALDRVALQARMARARAVVVPSLGPEGGPMVVVEAALAGRPTIVTDVPGAAELVVTHGNGIVVRRGDVSALADAIDGLLANPAEADRLGAAGRTAALQRHSAEAAVKAVRAVYAEAMRKVSRS